MRCSPNWKISPSLEIGVAASSGSSGPSSSPSAPVAEKDLIDLVESEPRNLDRRICHNERLELNLQGVEVPLTLLAQAVHREPKHALLLRVQVIDANARGALEAQLAAIAEVEQDVLEHSGGLNVGWSLRSRRASEPGDAGLGPGV